MPAFPLIDMRDSLLELATQIWFAANHLAGYALLNLLDDPALLAMAFC